MAKSATPMDAWVGARLRSRRKQLKISQQRLGNEVGVSFQQVQKYENGTNRIGAGRLAEFSKVLGVPVAYFFAGASPAGGAGVENTDPAEIASEPGADDLLCAYVQIGSLDLRNAVVRLARNLGGVHVDERLPAKSAPARRRKQLQTADR